MNIYFSFLEFAVNKYKVPLSSFLSCKQEAYLEPSRLCKMSLKPLENIQKTLQLRHYADSGCESV